mgnify:CR=1 FL=1
MLTYVNYIVLILALAGCASTAPIRLGPGDCVVLPSTDQVIVAGSGCDVKRLYR